MRQSADALQFAANAPKLLLVDIIERTCRQAVIHEIPGIGRCMKVFNNRGEFDYKAKNGDRIVSTASCANCLI